MVCLFNIIKIDNIVIYVTHFPMWYKKQKRLSFDSL